MTTRSAAVATLLMAIVGCSGPSNLGGSKVENWEEQAQYIEMISELAKEHDAHVVVQLHFGGPVGGQLTTGLILDSGFDITATMTLDPHPPNQSELLSVPQPTAGGDDSSAVDGGGG